MRLRIIKILFLFIVVIKVAVSELQGPPLTDNDKDKNENSNDPSNEDKQETNSNELKQLRIIYGFKDENNNEDDNSNEDMDEKFNEIVENVKSYVDKYAESSSFRDELNSHGSVIKIIKAPDLLKEKESRMLGDATDELMEAHRKWIGSIETKMDTINRGLQLIKEIKDITMTAEEIELENAYEEAIKIFNRSRTGQIAGYAALKEIANKGHEKAQAEIAWAQLMGNIVELNVVEARQTFLKLAEKGLPSAQMGLGFMYATGIGLNVNQAKALVYYTMAAIGNEPWAQMALGYRYWAGVTVASSCEEALNFYRKVAEKVASQVTFSGGTGVHRVRLLDEIEHNSLTSGVLDNNLVEYYQLLADTGDVHAQVGLGQLHFQGSRGIPLDHQKALQYFTTAANAGNAIAMAFLGKLYLEGNDNIKADNDTAFKYFFKSAKLGNPIGQSGLGLMYLQGRGVERDTVKALDYFTLAADQGWVDGQLQLGNMYFSGIGVPRDFKLASKYFNLASQAGHVLAYYNLGQMHAVGLGMMRSCPTAVELFKNVAERGRWSEILMDGHLAYSSYRFESAFMQYAIAAELGYEVAQSNAGFMLDREETNLFEDRNEELVRALQYWRRAAAQGYSAAQVKLGDYHYYGLGTPVDYDAAASHYRIASDQHHNAQAMFNLGYMHEQGLGMKKDWHLAKRCYDLAAETSVDAKVPVALALLKLSFMFKWESFKESPFAIILELDENITSNWDLYLITILTILLGIIFYFRNPPNVEVVDDQPVDAEQEQPEPQTEQATVPQPATSSTIESPNETEVNNSLNTSPEQQSQNQESQSNVTSNTSNNNGNNNNNNNNDS